jgi:topoisomerase-4 subunit B
MYIGGTDERALHHLFAEVLDNAMDEAVAKHAKSIWVDLDADGVLSVRDDGRGIPVDPHPKHPGKSALEVVMTVLHSGGKFSGKAYETSGGLHGVGSSVVNALAERLEVEVARDRVLWGHAFERGKPLQKLKNLGSVQNRRGTQLRFKPDPEIFGKLDFNPARLHRFCRSKAYLFRGVEIRWTCAPERIIDATPETATFHFPNGLADALAERLLGNRRGRLGGHIRGGGLYRRGFRRRRLSCLNLHHGGLGGLRLGRQGLRAGFRRRGLTSRPAGGFHLAFGGLLPGAHALGCCRHSRCP